jgi:hypothetical protein
MTTSRLAIHSVGDRSSFPAKHREASDRIAIGGLSVTFFLSFSQFCLERGDAIRLLPIVLLIGTSALLILVSVREKRRRLLSAAFGPATVLLISVVCLPVLLTSMYRPTLYPFEYGLVLIATLFAIRLVLTQIGLEGLILSFFYGTTAGIFVVVGLTFPDLLASVGAKRYAPFFYDPNRIAYFAVTAIPAQLWFATRHHGKKYVLLVSTLCVLVTGVAASRGSIGALAIGAMVAGALYFGRWIKFRSLTITKNGLMAALALLCLLTIAGAAWPSMLDRAGRYLSTKLQLDDRARGMDSGFTGRAANWVTVVGALPKTSWVLGNGYRTSEKDFSFPIDNGYLATVYELGVIAAAIILAKYAVVLFQLTAGYFSLEQAPSAVLLALAFTLVVFFANGFVLRAFFGDGDPASIVALFAFVSTRRDVIEEVQTGLLESPSLQFAIEVQ